MSPAPTLKPGSRVRYLPHGQAYNPVRYGKCLDVKYLPHRFHWKAFIEFDGAKKLWVRSDFVREIGNEVGNG